jgi:MFS family permease
MTKMDELLESVGAFGKFQYKTVLIVGLMSALTSGCIYATIFIAGEPTFICTRQETRQINLNETYQDEDDACQIWSQIKDHQNKSHTNYTCSFDTQYYDKTIITEYNLVCERQYLAGLTQTSHILGSTFGFCGGIFGDKYGRRKSTLLFSFLLTVCLIVTQAALNITSLSVDVRYIVYTTGQFFVGLLVNCLYCTAYVLLLEFTTEEYHTKLANMNSYIYVMGELVVAVVYYFSRDWNVLCWFIGICSLALLVLAYYFLPESPAWLIESKQHKQAVKVLRQMAKFNGRKSFLIEFKQDDLTAMLASSQTWVKIM